MGAKKMEMVFTKEDWQEEKTLLVQKTVRSGQCIRFSGNVVVLGDVNPGAEIAAEGHVAVFGCLRGLVHAGAAGNKEAVIIAFALEPTQLRIADHITRPPDGGKWQASSFPEIAHIQNNVVVIDRYLPSK